MSKNIVVCCDGTGNEFGGDSNSNVVKLYTTLIVDQSQAAYYHPGVGTMGDPRARNWFEKQWSRVMGLAFGVGLVANVSDAYRYLMDSYAQGDNVYLFGFSRGSYTVRALASMLHMYGLLNARNVGLIPYIVRMFVKKVRRERGKNDTFEVAEEFKAAFSRDCPVYFMGVWDTVSSVGWIRDPLVLPYTARNQSIRIGRHAVSIDERRCYYRPNLWGDAFPGQDLKQVWFTGVHSDVGGSYPEKESGLSKMTLQWMLREAVANGLKVNARTAAAILGEPPPLHWMQPQVQPNSEACIHKSLHGAWWILEFLPHRYVDRRGPKPKVRYRIPLGAARYIPDGSTIYELARPHVEWRPSFHVEPACKVTLSRAHTSAG